MSPTEILSKTARYLNCAYSARVLYTVRHNPYINLKTGKWNIKDNYPTTWKYDGLSTKALLKVLALC